MSGPTFPARGAATARRSHRRPHAPTERSFQIDAALDADRRSESYRARRPFNRTAGLRAMAFEAARAMQITSVRVDGQPAELAFRRARSSGATAIRGRYPECSVSGDSLRLSWRRRAPTKSNLKSRAR